MESGVITLLISEELEETPVGASRLINRHFRTKRLNRV